MIRMISRNLTKMNNQTQTSSRLSSRHIDEDDGDNEDEDMVIMVVMEIYRNHS